jgi:hypothetical protein
MTEKKQSVVKRKLRSLDVEANPTKEDALKEIESLIEATYKAKKKADKETSEYKKQRKNLFVAMVNARLKSKEIKALIGDTEIELEAFIQASEKQVVDVKALSKLVEAEDIIQIASVTLEEAKKKFGSVILTKCTYLKKGTLDVTVSPVKR